MLTTLHSISPKGKSVVDYLCVPHDVFQQCNSFRVITIQSIIDDHSLHGLLGQRSRPPDHSVLIARVYVNSTYRAANTDTGHITTDSQPKYKLNNIPSNFMSSDISRRSLVEIISLIESSRETQHEIDNIYSKLCDSIVTELESTVPRYEVVRSIK